MRRIALILLLALALGALTLYVYRDLPARLFAADDFQWLLNVRGQSFGKLVRQAFDIGTQSHFYRPLVWIWLWAQARAFDLDPRGYHAVSLALHLLNAALLGWLAWRLAAQLRIENEELSHSQPWLRPWRFSILNPRFFIPVLAAAFVALHPAPFEAVVWISAQSELLAAALLLIALHLWLSRRQTTDHRPPIENQTRIPWSPVVGGRWSVLATLALALALLAKESAVIGLPLLFLIDAANVRTFQRSNVQRWAVYCLPGALLLGYIALQVVVEQRNYLVRQGDYSLGWQVVLNPLRGLALIVAPLAGTEHADAGWLVPVGALVALGLLVLLVRGPASARRLVLALGLTLLPTAPFAAPPNSRYLYLPVMAAGLLLALGLNEGRSTKDERESAPGLRLLSFVVRLGAWVVILGLIWVAAGELRAREGRFAAGAGPGGSLWQLASSVCGERRPDRMIVVEPPVAGPHVEAIIRLSCGSRVKPVIVGRDQVAGAIKGASVVISFPNGSAVVEAAT